MLVAGEIPKGNTEPFRLPYPVTAIIALSPYADSGSTLSVAEESREKGAGFRGGSQGARKGKGRRRDSEKASDGNSESDSGRSRGLAASPTDRAMSVSLIQGVTTAFLDAYLKQDSVAHEWLKKDARGWMGDRGELIQK